MKIKIIFYILIILNCFVWDVFAEKLYNSAVCYIDFEESEPSMIKDKTAYQNNAFPIRSRDSYPEGLYGKGFHTDTQNGGFNLKPSESMKFSDDFTVMFWIKPEKFGDKTKLFSRRNRRTETNFIILAEEAGYIYAACGQGRDFTLTPKKFKLTLNKWQHITLSLNKSNNMLTLFVNGKVISTTSCRYSLENINTEFSFGADFEGTTSFFDGFFDNILFLNESVTSTDINNYLKNTSKNLSNHDTKKVIDDKKIAAWFPFDSIINKQSPSWQNATGTASIKGSGIYLQKGKSKGALSFVGTEDSYVHLKNFDQRSFNQDFSLKFWIKPRSEEKKQQIFYIPSENDKNFMKAFYSKDTIYFEINSKNRKYTLKSNNSEIHKWHLLTLVHEHSFKSLKLYKDDMLVDEIQLKDPLTDFSSIVYLGNYKSEGKISPYLGEIDEFMVLQKNLEINDIANAYKSLNPDSFVLERSSLFMEANKIIEYNFDHDWPGLLNDLSGTNISAEAKAKEYSQIFALGYKCTGLNLNNMSKFSINKSPLLDSASEFTMLFYIKPGDEEVSILSSFNTDTELFNINYDGKTQKISLSANNEKDLISFNVNKYIWSNIAVTFNNRLNTMSAYLNGALQEKKRLPTTATLNQLLNTLYIDNTNSKSTDKPTIIDELQIYAVQLGESEIKSLIDLKPQERKPEPQIEKTLASENQLKTPPPQHVSNSIPSENKPAIKKIKTDADSEESVQTEMKKPEIKETIIYPLGVPQNPFSEKFQWNPSQLSLFKKQELTAFFFFESFKDNQFFSDYSSSTTFNIQTNSKFTNVPGKNGMGVYFDKDTKAIISPLKLRLPPKFSIIFDIFPLNEKSEEQSLLQLKNKSDELLKLKISEGRIFLKTSANPGWERTMLLLSEKNWQQIGIAYSHESEKLIFFKNHKIIDEKKISFTLSPKLDLILGAYSPKIPSLNCIIDNLKFFRTASEKVIKPLNLPSNPFISIQNSGTDLRTADELSVLLHCNNAASYILSHSKDFLGTKWKDLRHKVTIPSAHLNGDHTLYCKFKNDDGFESDVVTCNYQWGFSNKQIRFINPTNNSTIAGRR